MDDCIFCKVIKGDLPSTKFFEDENVIVIKDVHPQRPFHVLVIPKTHIEDFAHLEDDSILISVRKAIQKLTKEQGLMTKGYRIEVNGGGAQLVNHLHFHLMSPMEKFTA